MLGEGERRRFLAEVLRIDDVVAWLTTALDLERRKVADSAFHSIASADERLRHD